jgi:hypothetical protein
MNKIITLSIATIFLATSYASHSQNIEHQSPHHKMHAICCADVLSVSVSDNRRRIFSSSLVVLLML